MKNTQQIGIKILNLRKKINLTQEELAEKLGITRQTIQKYETGIITNIKYSTIEKLAKIFNVSPQYLLGIEEQKLLSKDDIKKENMAFFGNKDITDEDKDEIFNALQEFYFKQKFNKK